MVIGFGNEFKLNPRAVRMFMMLRTTISGTAIMFAAVLWALPVFGAVEPAGIFTDSMVLQRDMRVPVWGWAAVGEQITIVFNGQTVQATPRDSTVAAYKGYWKAWLQPMNAGGPFGMTITGSVSGAVSLKGILIGDVWVCSGQSNMAWSMNMAGLADTSPEVQTLPPDNQPLTQLRLCRIGNCIWTNPALDIRKTEINWGDGARSPWHSCSRTIGKDYPQTPVLFGVTLQRRINIPIGIIAAGVSATALTLWVNPELSDTIVYRLCGQNPAMPIAARPPVRFGTWGSSADAGCCYNGQINPLVGMAIKGVVWWQGEQESWDASPVCAYSTGGFRKLIRDWRRRWGQGDFPFIFVQMQQGIGSSPSVNEVRDAQLQVLDEPNIGMAAIFDSCNVTHPPKLVPVARLALAVRAVAYGEKIEYMGPIYDSMIMQGNSIRIRFAHAGGGLIKKDIASFEGSNNLAAGAKVLSSSSDANAPFEIAGSDNVYRNADAFIEDSTTVVVSAPGVSAPKNVRYAIEIPGLAKTPLYNANNLPASMFRTATWTGLGGHQTGACEKSPIPAVKPATRTLAFWGAAGGRIVLPKELTGKVQTVGLYNARGQFITAVSVGSEGMVNIGKKKTGKQLVFVNITAF
jgi:sialate O-acetylesterase